MECKGIGSEIAPPERGGAGIEKMGLSQTTVTNTGAENVGIGGWLGNVLANNRSEIFLGFCGDELGIRQNGVL